MAAIANYTNQLADASFVSESRQVALKFLSASSLHVCSADLIVIQPT